MPKGILLDYGGTLVEEVGFNARAGNEALLKLAAYTPPNVTIDLVLERAGVRDLEGGVRDIRVLREVGGVTDNDAIRIQAVHLALERLAVRAHIAHGIADRHALVEWIDVRERDFELVEASCPEQGL